MSVLKIVIPASFLLTACIFETPEEKVARTQQFNGKTLLQVSDIIGAPSQQTTNTAIWTFDKTVAITETTYENFVRGKERIIGDVTETTHFNCTYTAELNQGRIVASIYEGNSCKRFAPPVYNK